MIAKWNAVFELFKEGRELTNAVDWKNNQIICNIFIGLLGAIGIIAKVFGYDLHLDGQTLQTASVGLVAVYGAGNTILTLITSRRVGLATPGESNK